VFGQKDFQQLTIIRRMVADLCMPMSIVAAPTVREPDGLAMSSRNAYLSAADRARALGLSRGLAAAWRAHATGERRAETLRGLARAEVERAADSIDYVDVTDAASLAPYGQGASVGDRALVAIACRVGGTRLIDNVVLGEDPLPSASGG
jgi:pantoate--beta-alanine ligase